jgi:hypothetical protein
MASSLVAALALGFIADSQALPGIRLPYCTLIVGTWSSRRSDGGVVAWEFHRNGHVTLTVQCPDGSTTNDSGTYRVDSQRLRVSFGGAWQAADVVQLNGRLLVLRWEGASGTGRFRRR